MPPERPNGGVRSGLVRYVLAAVLVRGADSGAAVGLVLLALDPGSHLRRGAAVGGLLAAALSAPHLLGPWIGHRLDRSGDGRRVLAAAYLGYGAALAAGAIALGRAPAGAAIALVAVAGLCGPLLTGGLSSRLPDIAGPGPRALRRAQGWDAVTYGLAGTTGPAVVAAGAALLGPLTALLCLSGATAVAAAVTMTLPRDRADRAEEAVPGVRAGMRLLVSRAPLRRVTVMTLFAALGWGGLPIITAVLGPRLTARPGAAATLMVAYGLGNLAGSLGATVVPLRGEPETLALRIHAVLAATTALCAVAPAYAPALAGFGLVGVAGSTGLTATLAARSAYAPPAARAQVFVTSAGLKVAAAAAGSAAAGAAAGLGGRVLLLFAAAVTGGGVLIAAADRALTRRHDGSPGRAAAAWDHDVARR